jgi:DNA-binding response OmpR family regulator
MWGWQGRGLPVSSSFARGGLQRSSSICACRTSPAKTFASKLHELLRALPVIVLSATADVADKVVLLEIGARDYVTKPFSPRELLARVRVALRSPQADLENTFCFDGATVSFPNAEVMRGGRSLGLTPKEFKTLKFMIQNAGRVISRRELLNEVWGYHDYPHTRTVDNHILSLRNKLES